MVDAQDRDQDRLTSAEIDAFSAGLEFVREYGIRMVSIAPGEVTIELPFDKRFSGPPGQFPASIVGMAGDVAAVTSCLSLLLRARGRVLQAGRTNSVGAADVYAVSGDDETLCGTVLATTRNFQIKPEKTAA